MSTTLPKRTYTFSARFIANGQTIHTAEKQTTEQRYSARSTRIQNWLDGILNIASNANVTKIEVDRRLDGGHPHYLFFDVRRLPSGIRQANFNLRETNDDPRNKKREEENNRRFQEQRQKEMDNITEPFDGDPTGFAWDIAHNLVQFTGKRDAGGNLEVYVYRKTNGHYYVRAGKPVWTPPENIVTKDPMTETSATRAVPVKSMWPYFNGIDAELSRKETR
jgi:hypothetical protein